MVLYKDMLVETPYRLTEVEDRVRKPDHEDLNQCTYCGVQEGDTWHPVAEITVYRVWTSDAVYRPEAPGVHEQGGAWQWRCSDHPKGSWAPHSHEAPPLLIPPERHPCEEIDGLSMRKCGVADGARRFEEGWFCPAHSRKYEVLAEQRRLLGDEDPEAGIGA